MSKLQIAVINVEGGDEAIRDALKAGIALVDHQGANHVSLPVVSMEPPVSATDHEIKQAAARISNGTVSRAVAKVRKAAAAADPLACPECGRACANRRGFGKHRSAMHGVRVGYFKKTKPDRNYLPCGTNGCFEKFSSVDRREKHWSRVHGVTG
jgi:hypothetical protein